MKLTDTLLGNNGLSISRKTIAALLREVGPDVIVWENSSGPVPAGLLSKLVEEGHHWGMDYAANLLRRVRAQIQLEANPRPVYRLIVPAGEYQAPSLRGLVVEVLKHRWNHFIRGEGWVD